MENEHFLDETHIHFSFIFGGKRATNIAWFNIGMCKHACVNVA